MCTDAFIKDRLAYYEDLADDLIGLHENVEGACTFGLIADTSILGDLIVTLSSAISFYRCKADRSLDADEVNLQVRRELMNKIIDIMPDSPSKRALTRGLN